MYLLDLVAEHARRFPQRVAASDTGTSLTYGELMGRASAVAASLTTHRVAGRAILVCGGKTVDMVVAMVGVWLAGAAFVPVEPGPRMDSIADDTDGPILLCLRDVPVGLERHRQRLILTESLGRSGRPLRQTHLNPASPACVMYTSGSSGRPKGVMLSHANVASYTRAMLGALGLDGEGEPLRFAHVSSLTTDLGNTCLYAALACAGSVRLFPPEAALDPATFRLLMRQEAIDVLKITPSHFRALLGKPPLPGCFPRRLLVLGGERLEFDLVDGIAAQDPPCRVFNHYGPTETTVGAFCIEVGDAARWRSIASAVPIGLPLGGVTYTLRQVEGEPGPPADEGELWIGGPSVALGYLNDESLTQTRFVATDRGRYYRTGDRCRRLPGGALEFLGRLDRQVKVRGFRVEPAEIEAALRSHPSVLDAAVVALDRQTRVELVAAVVTTCREADCYRSEVVNYLRTMLPEHLLPHRVLVIDRLPLKPSGKVDYASIQQMADQAGASPSIDAPAWGSRARMALAAAWSQVLGIGAVGDNDDFFALGGDSLSAIHVSGRVARAGYRLHPQLILDTANFAGQLAHMDEAPANVAVGDHGSAPITHNHHVFFATGQDRGSNWNQSVMLDLSGECDPKAVWAALEAVMRRHAALRTAYRRVGGEWVAEQTDTSPAFCFLDLRDSSHSYDARRRAHAAIQRRVHIGSGRLLSALLSLDSDGCSRLLLAAHHLAVDAVAWLVLLEDLDNHLDAILRGRHRDIAAPAGQCYRTQLSPYPPGAGHPNGRPLPHPRRLRGLEHNGTEGATVTLWWTLDAQATTAVIGQYRRGCADILLSCLGEAVRPCTHGPVDVDIESHGRPLTGDPSGPAAGTVGWFSTIRRVALPTSGAPAADSPDAVGSAVVVEPADGCCASVCFNFVGAVSSHRFRHFALSAAPPAEYGQCRFPESPRSHPVRMTARVVDGRLAVDVNYDPTVVPERRVREIFDRFVAEIWRQRRTGTAVTMPAPQRIRGSSAGLIFTAPATGSTVAARPGRRPSATAARGPILLTGATGFIGVNVVRELLLTTGRTIYCLVRAEDAAAGRRRVVTELRTLFPHERYGRQLDRLRCVPLPSGASVDGVLAGFDLPHVAAVFHLAADVRLLAPRAELEHANVAMTRDLLDWVRQTGCRRLVFSSTLGLPSGADQPTAPLNAYLASKLAAEQLIRSAAGPRLQVAIVRSGHVAADSLTGRHHRRNRENDRQYAHLAEVVRYGVAPHLPGHRLAFSHVDVVARRLVRLGLDADPPGADVGLESPWLVPHAGLVAGLRLLGYGITVVDPQTYAGVVGRPDAGVGDLGWGMETPEPAVPAFEGGSAFPRPTLSWLRRMVQDCVAAGFLAPPPAWSQAPTTGWQAVTIAGDPFLDTLAAGGDAA